MTAAPPKYRSGEEVKEGDRVRFHGNAAEIEFVATDPSDPDPEMVWFVKEYGGGVMVLDPFVSGRTFIHSDRIDNEDLEFVLRGQSIQVEDRRPKTNDQGPTTE